MIILSCKDICKSYGIRDILKDITFSINEGDKVGIIGANGEGKSTLFKIITKEISQDSGEIFIDKNKTLGYLSQNLALDSDKNIYEETLSVFEEILNIEETLSSLETKITYSHAYCPVRLGDCVRLNYSRFGLNNVKAKVINQKIKCEPGCPVTETAVYTIRLWDGGISVL